MQRWLKGSAAGFGAPARAEVTSPAPPSSVQAPSACAPKLMPQALRYASFLEHAPPPDVAFFHRVDDPSTELAL
jgi:hypothetical protein